MNIETGWKRDKAGKQGERRMSKKKQEEVIEGFGYGIAESIASKLREMADVFCEHYKEDAEIDVKCIDERLRDDKMDANAFYYATAYNACRCQACVERRENELNAIKEQIKEQLKAIRGETRQ